MQNLACDIQMSTLISEYGYMQGQMLLAQVRAANQVGWGSFSPQNSAGAIVQTIPTFMNKPQIDTSLVTDE
jgi:hypothetical protein